MAPLNETLDLVSIYLSIYFMFLPFSLFAHTDTKLVMSVSSWLLVTSCLSALW